MPYDIRKHEGTMCCYRDCTSIERLHKIVRICDNCEQVVVWRYCDDHITKMMFLAMYQHDVLPDGTRHSKMICLRCFIPLRVLLE